MVRPFRRPFLVRPFRFTGDFMEVLVEDVSVLALGVALATSGGSGGVWLVILPATQIFDTPLAIYPLPSKSCKNTNRKPERRKFRIDH